MEVGLGLIHDNRPWRLLHQPTQLSEFSHRVGAFPGLAGTVSCCRAVAQSPVADAKIRRDGTSKMEQHQYGGKEAGKEGHWSLRE